MAAIRGRDTKPEMIIRRGLHARGFRFRLHNRRLPGSPDLVLRKWRTAVFVHGCFWHAHDCEYFKIPATRTDWWLSKLAGNVSRDLRTEKLLAETGWRIALIWGCAFMRDSFATEDEILDSVGTWITSQTEVLHVTGNGIFYTGRPDICDGSSRRPEVLLQALSTK